MTVNAATEPDVTSAPALTPTQVQALRALGSAAGGASAARLLGLLYDPDVDPDRILTCLHSEPALAARVLKVANSPYYGQSGRVGSVQRAVQLLGFKAIRGIAAAGALDRLTPGKSGQAFDPVQFRRHSGAVACVAQALSARLGCGIDGEAFMAGLLHDIGVLLLVKTDGAAMASHATNDLQDEAMARRAERQHFGMTHEEAGAIMVRSWALPEWLAQALALHHDVLPPPTARQGIATLPALLQLADRLASGAGYGMWGRCAMPIDVVLLDALGATQADLVAIGEGLPAAVEALALDA